MSPGFGSEKALEPPKREVGFVDGVVAGLAAVPPPKRLVGAAVVDPPPNRLPPVFVPVAEGLGPPNKPPVVPVVVPVLEALPPPNKPPVDPLAGVEEAALGCPKSPPDGVDEDPAVPPPKILPPVDEGVGFDPPPKRLFPALLLVFPAPNAPPRNLDMLHLVNGKLTSKEIRGVTRGGTIVRTKGTTSTTSRVLRCIEKAHCRTCGEWSRQRRDPRN